MIEAYILDADHKPVPTTMLEWAFWMETDEAIVTQTQVGEIVVSTVFVGLCSHVINAKPYFETMCFKAHKSQGYQTRCATWDGALAMHAAGLTWAKEKSNGL